MYTYDTLRTSTAYEPSGVRKDEKVSAVDGTQAVSFPGFDARIGQTCEVWFIKGGLLYEIMSTWRFLPNETGE